MEKLLKCPKCNAKDSGCDYCGHTGFVIEDSGNYYAVELGPNDKPIKGKQLAQPHQSGAALGILMPKGEPHDLIWYLKERYR